LQACCSLPDTNDFFDELCLLCGFFFVLLDLTAWLPPKFCGVFSLVSATPEVALSLKQDI
jgi:hypothetical protein